MISQEQNNACKSYNLDYQKHLPPQNSSVSPQILGLSHAYTYFSACCSSICDNVDSAQILIKQLNLTFRLNESQHCSTPEHIMPYGLSRFHPQSTAWLSHAFVVRVRTPVSEHKDA